MSKAKFLSSDCNALETQVVANLDKTGMGAYISELSKTTTTPVRLLTAIDNPLTTRKNPNAQNKCNHVMSFLTTTLACNKVSSEQNLIKKSSIQKRTDTNNQVESSQKSTSTRTEDSTHIEKQASSVESSSADATLVLIRMNKTQMNVYNFGRLGLKK